MYLILFLTVLIGTVVIYKLLIGYDVFIFINNLIIIAVGVSFSTAQNATESGLSGDNTTTSSTEKPSQPPEGWLNNVSNALHNN